MDAFSLLVKPAGADCNLRCGYCFYLEKGALYEGRAHRMDDATLVRLVRGYLALPFGAHTFAFQGGEPLLMGEDFFRRVVALQRRYGRVGARILNCVQTNGTLVTPSLAKFFAEEDFLLGVSVDGPAEIHDARRRTADGRGSHALVIRGLEYLKAAGVKVNLLTLVSQSNVRSPREVYTYLTEVLGCRHLQFIECVETGSPDSISAEEWADFMIGIFDAWFERDRTRVSIRLFDSVVSKLLTGNANSCAMGCDCRSYFVVEHNGDVYPCDFFVEPSLRLGNVHEQDWDELWDDPRHTAFGARKRVLHADCKVCPYVNFCQGDCPKNRSGHGFQMDGAAVRSQLCEGWKRIYAHILPRLEAVARILQRGGTLA